MQPDANQVTCRANTSVRVGGTHQQRNAPAATAFEQLDALRRIVSCQCIVRQLALVLQHGHHPRRHRQLKTQLVADSSQEEVAPKTQQG